MPTTIQKNPVINNFINNVITPARNAIQYDRADHPAGTGDVSDGTAGGEVGFPLSLAEKSTFNINPNSFNNINPLGGRITASDLAIVFQHYAYNLTAIRRATIRRYRNYGGAYVGWDPIVSNRITALSPEYRELRTVFNSRVVASPNPLTDLEPGKPASLSSINALISRLASILASKRSEAAITISTCHNSCHSNCHGSRGRR
jgi:hypothetical protein